jgi:hypothetical protein
MSWLFKHKLLLLFIITGIWYWANNPADRFGLTRAGFVVYNKIPVFWFDCYVSPAGKLYLAADLSKSENVTYWLDNHVSVADFKTGSQFHLLVGTGFKDTNNIVFDTEQIRRLREMNCYPELLPSAEAIAKFNTIKNSGASAGILLKVMAK